jgi:hypothetical protein
MSHAKQLKRAKGKRVRRRVEKPCRSGKPEARNYKLVFHGEPCDAALLLVARYLLGRLPRGREERSPGRAREKDASG